VPGCEVQIVDPKSNTLLPDGTMGEVVISGPSVTCGYWGEIEVVEGRLTREPTAQPFRTGDLGFLDSGELYVTGRKKDLMIVGGRNLYPQDIERSAMKAHEAVENCASFTIDTAEGERVIVLAEVKRGLRNGKLSPVRGAIQRALLEEHDVSIADLVFVNPLSIPRTSSGKVKRFSCREHYLSQTVPGMIQDCKAQESNGSGIRDQGSVSADMPVMVGLRDPDREQSSPGLSVVTNYIRHWASEHLGLEPASITSTSKLSELGLDSLRAIDLQLSLLRDCGLSVSPSAFADGVSVGELARRSQFVVPSEPPLAVLLANETVELRFNVMPERFVQETLFTKTYRIWKGYAEALFDRDYKSEMLASPDHLIFLTALTHTQKLAYVCMAYELGFSPEPNAKERFKFWPTDVRVTMPQMVTQSSNLCQQLWVYDKRHISGNKYQVKCRTLIGSMEILIDSTMLMLEPASGNDAAAAYAERTSNGSASVRRNGSGILCRGE